jgi:O-antigen/teichoic acid export membrane protein
MDAEMTLGDVDLSTVKARSITGIVTLISRSFVLQIISTLGFFLLSMFLGRPEIGLFIAVNDLVSILGYFSDIGLAASLIQKKDKVTVTDLRTTFTLQQILVLTMISLTLLASSWIINYYHIEGGGLWLFYSLLVAFFLASLKTIPSVILERQLKFEVLAAVEVVETIAFYLIAVYMAWRGFGVSSYVLAVLVRGLLGTTMIYLLAPWNIGISVSRNSLKSLLSFGLPYQINSLMAVVKDRFLNIILWKLIGAEGVGIIGWAQTWSQKPLRFIMDNVTKVTFPGFSRMQDHPQELKSGIEKTLQFISLITFPIVGGMAVIAPTAVHLIPKYAKWEVALLPLALYCWGSAWAAVSTPLTNTLNALGKVKTNTYLMIMWTTLTWALTPALAVKFGYLGVAYATGIIAVSSVVPIILVKRLVDFSIWESIFKPASVTVGMLVVTWVLTFVLPKNIVGLAANIILSVVTFSFFVYLAFGKKLFADTKLIYYAFRKKI